MPVDITTRRKALCILMTATRHHVAYESCGRIGFGFPISQQYSRFSWCLLCVDARDVLHDCEQEMTRDGERVVHGSGAESR
jgi:hypothetical protein